ncbi:MAG: hypothetical protein ACOYMV_11005, partial [Verrucomicrobiia bacterium]
WTAGSLSQSYDIDASNTGNDVTVSATSTTTFTSSYPRLGTSPSGGLSPAQNSLLLSVNWSATSQSTTLTVDFGYANGVEGVTFSLFDVDRSSGGTPYSYQDEISNIAAYYDAGYTIAPNSVTGSPNNSVTGSGLSYNVIGTANSSDTTSDANVQIAFNGPIKGFQFTFSPGPNSQSNPSTQVIAMNDITFLPVIPEAGVVPAAAAGFVLAFLALRRMRRSAPEES